MRAYAKLDAEYNTGARPSRYFNLSHATSKVASTPSKPSDYGKYGWNSTITATR
jgi:hypothetical protein